MSSHDARGAAIKRQIAAGSRGLGTVAGPNGAGKTTFVDTFLHPLETRVQGQL